jgi:NAD(P)-dependent dehydrogenase (short-subunit alcohol dehydrogenase family)
MKTPKTVSVTAISQGIGTNLVKTFLERSMKKTGFQVSNSLALIDGDSDEARTARDIVALATEKSASIDVLMNDTQVFFTQPLTDYIIEDFRKLFSTNLDGFIYLSQGECYEQPSVFLHRAGEPRTAIA